MVGFLLKPGGLVDIPQHALIPTTTSKNVATPG